MILSNEIPPQTTSRNARYASHRWYGAPSSGEWRGQGGPRVFARALAAPNRKSNGRKPTMGRFYA